ncbi:hypothetical protein PanWU01x14_314340 [Parasponia andersonii]|uniref:LRR domain containing protein n=1 Tax=Parasponia andersonii TaxID=3476 RepID=A0A2P5ANT4_PARAD|nr:hypothetical protein PanWU01x14_314340 [Parasponia andersonii]
MKFSSPPPSTTLMTSALRKLTLTNVVLEDETVMRGILAASPLLEDLVLADFRGLPKLQFCSPKLKTLRILLTTRRMPGIVVTSVELETVNLQFLDLCAPIYYCRYLRFSSCKLIQTLLELPLSQNHGDSLASSPFRIAPSRSVARSNTMDFLNHMAESLRFRLSFWDDDVEIIELFISAMVTDAHTAYAIAQLISQAQSRNPKVIQLRSIHLAEHFICVASALLEDLVLDDVRGLWKLYVCIPKLKTMTMITRVFHRYIVGGVELETMNLQSLTLSAPFDY